MYVEDYWYMLHIALCLSNSYSLFPFLLIGKIDIYRPAFCL